MTQGIEEFRAIIKEMKLDPDHLTHAEMHDWGIVTRSQAFKTVRVLEKHGILRHTPWALEEQFDEGEPPASHYGKWRQDKARQWMQDGCVACILLSVSDIEWQYESSE